MPKLMIMCFILVMLQAEGAARLAHGTSEMGNSDGRSQEAAALLEAAEQERDTAKQQLAKYGAAPVAHRCSIC